MSRRNLSLPPLFLVLLMLLSACTPAPVPPAETTASADTASPETTAPGEKFQFVRVGYFCKDSKNADTFNRVVGLRDGFKA